MRSLASAIIAVVMVSSPARAGVPPLKPLASHALPARSDISYGACSVGADASYAAVGFAWGGRNPMSGGYDHFCRGFTLISLRTGTRRTVVRLPANLQKGLWTVDEPILVGNWLAYQRYVAIPGGPWEVDIVNIKTGASRRLDHSHGPRIPDSGRLLSKWNNTLVWISGALDARGRAVSKIHTYDVERGTGKVVATSRPGDRFIDAYMSGQLICFQQETTRGADLWIEDLRTHHFRQLTHTGRVGEAVITGPWVAWSIAGADDLGPVVVDNLRTGHRWTVAKEPSYQLTASNGLLAWDSYWKTQWTVLDLETGHAWIPGRIVAGQAGATTARVQGNVIVESAAILREVDLGQGRVVVYPLRALPQVPRW